MRGHTEALEQKSEFRRPVAWVAEVGGRPPELDALNILGVRIINATMARALQELEDALERGGSPAESVFFANSRTLNLTYKDDGYRAVLNRADYVFGDGTGVRWAAAMGRHPMLDNVNGTDLTPALLDAVSGKRVFLLGCEAPTIHKASRYFSLRFPNWTLSGCHHGFLNSPLESRRVVETINRAGTDLVLVGMGNPSQEQWIDRHRVELGASVVMGVGGLLEYWAGNLSRAPLWLRRAGMEWLGILVQQPQKARRYLLGNPAFMLRTARQMLSSRQSA